MSRSAEVMTMTAAVRPWTPQAIDLGPPMPSTMVASASGMIVAASVTQPSKCVAPAAMRMKTNSPDAMSRTPLTLK